MREGSFGVVDLMAGGPTEWLALLNSSYVSSCHSSYEVESCRERFSVIYDRYPAIPFFMKVDPLVALLYDFESEFSSLISEWTASDIARTESVQKSFWPKTRVSSSLMKGRSLDSLLQYFYTSLTLGETVARKMEKLETKIVREFVNSWYIWWSASRSETAQFCRQLIYRLAFPRRTGNELNLSRQNADHWWPISNSCSGTYKKSD